MPTYFLPVFQKNAFLELAERVPAVQAGAVKLRTMLEFCQWYRVFGIAALFLEGRPEPFLVALHKSGRAFADYLRRAPMSGKATSQAAPFFDAIASGDWDGAGEIAQRSRLTWNPDEEFEDDFQYVLFLMKHFFLGATAAEDAAILKRFEQILDGAADPHFDLCQAFAADDAPAFAAALGEVLRNHDRRYQQLMADDAVMPEEAATESKMCVEGLALVKLAERKKLPVEEDYLLIPSTARENASIVFAADDWKTP